MLVCSIPIVPGYFGLNPICADNCNTSEIYQLACFLYLYMDLNEKKGPFGFIHQMHYFLYQHFPIDLSLNIPLMACHKMMINMLYYPHLVSGE